MAYNHKVELSKPERFVGGHRLCSGCGAGIASFISAMLTSPFVVDSHERLFMCS